MAFFSRIKGPAFILVSCLFFSITGTLQQIAPPEASPTVVTEVRMALGAVTLWIWCLCNGEYRTPWRIVPKRVLAMMVGCICFYQLCFFNAVREVGVAVGTVVSIGSAPIWAAIVTLVVFGIKPSKLWYVATACAICGIVSINIDDLSIDNYAGLILPVAGAAGLATEIVFAKKMLETVPPIFAMFLELVGVALILLPFMVFFPVSWIFTADGLVVSLALGVLTAGFSFAFFIKGLSHTTPTVVSTLSLAEPLGATCLGIFFLHEPMPYNTLIGIVLLIASIVILLFEKPVESRS